MKYEVIVGNIGRVHSGENAEAAIRVYEDYVDASRAGTGRAGAEIVALMEDGEVMMEFVPEEEEE